MEVLLQLFDEMDDALAVARTLWPRILGLVLAGALFVATGLAMALHPPLAAATTLVLIMAILFEHLRRRRRSSPPRSRP